MRWFFLMLTVCAAGAFAPTKAVQAQEAWSVTLTKKQAKGLAEYNSKANPKAFAISPDGAWGFWYGADTAKENQKRALGGCRERLKRGKRDCIVYSSNGKIVAPKQVQTKTVSKVYKPGDGKLAPQVFGLIAASFRGNRDLAIQEFKALEQAGYSATVLRSDAVLGNILKAGSLVFDSKSGWVLYFHSGGGEQRAVKNGNVIRSQFNHWVATKNGLVCTFGEAWDTGKPIGTRCLVIEDMANGRVKFFWAAQRKPIRKANMVAGDARWGAVR